MSAELTLYSRAGCHLCEDMQAQLQGYIEQGEINLQVVDIDRQADFQARFNALVPVLMAGEKEICHYFLDLKALEEYMSK